MDAGIVTGCDRSREWQLPWWLDHYQKHNSIPIAFADFGMSDTMVRWCKNYGTVIDLTWESPRKNWFKKPLAILNSPFDKVLWLDTDCEVRRNLADLFSHCSVNSIGLTRDVPTKFNQKWIDPPIATGVIVAMKTNELIREWADACEHTEDIRGDQEVMCSLLLKRLNEKNITTQINIMPTEYQWLRLLVEKNIKPRFPVYIMHWTGTPGSRHILNDIQTHRNHLHEKYQILINIKDGKEDTLQGQ